MTVAALAAVVVAALATPAGSFPAALAAAFVVAETTAAAAAAAGVVAAAGATTLFVEAFNSFPAAADGAAAPLATFPEALLLALAVWPLLPLQPALSPDGGGVLFPRILRQLIKADSSPRSTKVPPTGVKAKPTTRAHDSAAIWDIVQKARETLVQTCEPTL